MNYRHVYHAGNHADVLKHIVLTRVIVRMQDKPKPMAILDAHAGTGHYDLMGEQAGKTLEWQSGIAKLSKNFEPAVEELLAPYRGVLASMNEWQYPGSPSIAANLMRPSDRLLFNELHPEDHDALQENLSAVKNARITKLDALTAVKAALPFSERRGLVLIDPPFEVQDEFQRILQLVQQGLRRMANAVMLIWYPLKNTETIEPFLMAMKSMVPQNLLQVQIGVQAYSNNGPLSGSAVLVINPPWNLDHELQLLVPQLAERLDSDGTGSSQLTWLTPRT
jgi:23S rRNA (adenine2030-N6)-methyltransferase